MQVEAESERIGILYVDDSQTQLDAFRKGLSDGPYDVWTAQSAHEAQVHLAQPSIVMTIIDFHMPDMTGDRCLQLLKRAAGTERYMRYYLYTTDPDAFRRHRDMGFDGVLLLKGKTAIRTQVDAIARALLRYRV